MRRWVYLGLKGNEQDKSATISQMLIRGIEQPSTSIKSKYRKEIQTNIDVRMIIIEYLYKINSGSFYSSFIIYLLLNVNGYQNPSLEGQDEEPNHKKKISLNTKGNI